MVHFTSKSFINLASVGGLVLLILFVFSCKINNEIAYTNLSSNYNPEAELHFEGLRIFNESDSLSRVFLQYNTSELNFKQVKGKSYFRANYGISFQLFSSYESNVLLDQGIFFMVDSLHYQNPTSLKLDFTVKAKQASDYLLELKFYDFNADKSILFPCKIEKSSTSSPQDFLPIDEYGEVILKDWVSWKTKFSIKCRDQELKKLYVSYFNLDFPTALPPFSQAKPLVYDPLPEEEFTIEVNEGRSDSLQFVKEGFFQFKTDKNEQSGITLFRFPDFFPKVKRLEQLAPPLRYLTSNKEFADLMNAVDVKQVVDSFWLATAGSEDRAELLIKDYYGRVEQANDLFSSHKEGWKTDRGMIYIIYGAPRTVFKRTDFETWIYGEQGKRVYLTFDFVRAINPYSNNDFELQRQSDFKGQWYNAVLFWRQ